MTDRRFLGKPRFPALGTLGMIEADVERDGKNAIYRRYYLSSAVLWVEIFAAAVRAHWGVENCLHWRLDIVFHNNLMPLSVRPRAS